MPKLTVNGREIEVPAGATVLQACQQLGIEVPVFCYHARLSIAGNCRMCLVEIEKSSKPAVACAMPAADGMVVRTDSDMAIRARHGVMEFLLINHPLDCPICDQGGECDLQDEAIAYGFDRGRFTENKRAVKPKDFGPLIGTYMTRCIHCTRCIRFLAEVAGVPELGTMYRGEDMQIDTYVQKALSSELSGNVIDLCPVGALTSKPYSFAARPWELVKTQSIDVFDAVGSNIRIDSRGPQVMRVLPRLNEDINEEWLSDKSRFAVDGLTKRRLDRPFIRRDDRLVECSWRDAFELIAVKFKASGPRIAAIAGDMVDVESLFALKDLMTGLGSPHLDCRQDGAALDARCRAGYIFNTTIAGIEKADACLLIGTNPRYEAALINARLRKRWLQGGFSVAGIGPALDLTFPVTMLGTGPVVLESLIHGQHPWSAKLSVAKTPMLIVGQGALCRKDGAIILARARELAEAYGMMREDWRGFNVLHLAAGRVGGLDIGFVPVSGGLNVGGILEGASGGKIAVVYLLGADEFDTSRLGSAFVIYQGHHGDRGAQRADVILPGAAYTEKDALYVNTEGRPQLARRAVFPPGLAQEDWKILRALSEIAGCKLSYDSLGQLRNRLKAHHPIFQNIGAITRPAWDEFGMSSAIDSAPFAYPVVNFYQTDPISRASSTMAECTQVFRQSAPRPI